MKKDSSRPTNSNPAHNEAPYRISDKEREFLRQRASVFSARRENAIGWIDDTLGGIKSLRKVPK